MTEGRGREWRLTGIVFFAVIALVVLYAAFRILWPFVTAIILGAMIVTLTFSMFRRVRARLRGSSPAAAIVMLIFVTFVIVVPLFILAMMIIHQASVLVARLQTGEAEAILARLDIANRLMFIKRWVPNFDPQSVSPQHLFLPVVRAVPGWVAVHGREVVGGVAGLLIGFFLILLSAYFFYVEGETILEELALLSPLPERYDREFGAQFKDVIDATFRGHVLTALAQGVATTIGLLIAEVPGALFWGAVATLMSLLPMSGAAAVWVPAAIYLYVAAAMGKAAYWQAIFLTIWGTAGISVIDNVIRPWAMKGKSQLPAIPLLFAVLGGMQAFGFIGLVLGPLVFSLLMSVIDIYKKSFRIPRSESEIA